MIDRVRIRAEDSLSRAMPAREAALARGFVLGQDQEIDPVTVSDFQNSGLAHLLAVSGQNVVLLSLLGIAFMAAAGVGHRTRLVVLAGLILLYVPLAGGGPSIQRAGVMGLAGLAAIAASRPVSRVFVLALAAAVTLLINPRAGADVGWQLSFVAVIGIALLAGPLRRRLAGLGACRWRLLRPVNRRLPEARARRSSGDRRRQPGHRAADGLPLRAVPVATILANLAALPAVAPAMWLGHELRRRSALVWSGLSVPLNLLNSVLLAYIAQVAAWFGRPSWAVVEVGIGSVPALCLSTRLSWRLVGAGLWLTRGLGFGSGRAASGRRSIRRSSPVSPPDSVLFALALDPAVRVAAGGNSRRHRKEG